MPYVDLLVGVLMIVVAGYLFWFLLPIDGKVNPRLSDFTEPYAVIVVIGLAAFGFVTFLYGIRH